MSQVWPKKPLPSALRESGTMKAVQSSSACAVAPSPLPRA